MIRISEDAFDDLNQGFLFYETQSAGLGDYFVSCLRALSVACAPISRRCGSPQEYTPLFIAITTAA